jgi:hypothetical protein
MDRRTLIVSGLAVATGAAGPAMAQDENDRPYQGDQSQGGAPPYQGQDQNQDRPYRDDDRGYDHQPRPTGPAYGGPTDRPARTYERDEIAHNVSDFFGVTAENAGALIEKLFHENGRPTGYIAGQEGSGAFFFGLRYGKGLLYMKDRPTMPVFWQGPTGGFDFGGNASRVFTLCYDLEYPDAIFRRFPGVEGSAYFIGGLGVNYQRADGITLAPVRAGVGLRLGASVGYLSYSRQRNIVPL